MAVYDNSVEYSYKLIYGKKVLEVKHPTIKDKTRIDSDQNNISLCDLVMQSIQRYRGTTSVVTKVSTLQSVFKTQDADKKYNVEVELMDIVDNLYKAYNNGNGEYYDRCIWENILRYSNSKLITSAGKNLTSAITKASNAFKKEFGAKLMPDIVKYEEKCITDKDLVVKHGSIGNDSFFKKVLSAINVNVSEVKNVYDLFETKNAKGHLTGFEKKVNKKLEKIAQDFNKLYYVDDGTYSFEMSFESENVYFYIMRDGEGMTLDYQSTGFKWFFNLYFNVLVGSELSAGDIIIMDEPATNLHVQGQYELRKFLKDFAIKNDITIIIATHSPFLIDMDYLDELRVVSNNNNISSISNDFSTIDLDDPDSLKPIKQALTVHNHILTDPDKKVVFVEGITDYNYMIAFKKLFDVDDIVFLPIKGVGDGKSPDIKAKQAEICKRLLQIRKHGPVLMVDGDKAGNAMQTNSKGKSELAVFTLKDVDESFTEIESLFTVDDLKKLGLADKNGKLIKHSSESAVFKTYIDIAKTVSQQTIDNFQKVFKYIETL